MKKVLSVLLSIVMLMGVFAVFAYADDRSPVVFSFSCFDDGIKMPMQSISASADEAGKFGYPERAKDHNGNIIDGVTVFDVLVAAHEVYYGESFTKETAKDYLDINDGQIILAFGKNARSSGFAVNNDGAYDDNFNEAWGAYTGYAADEAVVEKNDYISFFFYTDRTFYSDYYSWFEVDGEPVSSIKTFDIPYEVTFTLKGFCFGWYSCSKTEDKNIIALPGVDVYLKDLVNGEYRYYGQTDENGNITFTFPESNEYRICAYGVTEDDYDDNIPVVASYAEVTLCFAVDEPVKLTLWQRIVNFFKSIVDFFRSLFDRVPGLY